jgi:hypothetical protein
VKKLSALLLPFFLVITLCGFGPIGVLIGAVVFGSATSADMNRPRAREHVKPTLRPEQVLFGVSTSKTSLEWQFVNYDAENRARALAWVFQGRELPGGVFPVAVMPDGSYAFVDRYMVAWPGERLYTQAEIRQQKHPWHYGW